MAVSRLSKQSIQAGFPKQQTIWDQSTSVAGMDPISGITLDSSQSSITFNSIPSTYTHLQIRGIAFTDDTVNSGLGNIRLSAFFNSDTTTSNYYNHGLSGDGTATAYSDTNAKFAGNGVRNSMIAPGSNVIDILDYASTSKYKTVRTLSGVQNNDAYQLIRLISGLWMNTAAISSIQLVPESGSFKQYSSFALYGVK